MGPWRLELLRIWRTQRWIALGATFVILGLGAPILARYTPDLAKTAGNGVRVTVPTPTPSDGISSFGNLLAQLGTLVVLIVAAASFSVDAHPSLAAFYRTRLRGPVLLLLPRYLTVTVASLVALTVGTLAAWYQTSALLGAPPFGRVMIGLALEALWFCFVTSMVAIFTSTVRSPSGAVGSSIALLLALVGVGSFFKAASSWLPPHLVQTAGQIVKQPAGNVWHAVLVSGVATVVAVSLAVYLLGKRDLDSASGRRVKKRALAKSQAGSMATTNSP
jgi:ABC-2 type transport system permease protein